MKDLILKKEQLSKELAIEKSSHKEKSEELELAKEKIQTINNELFEERKKLEFIDNDKNSFEETLKSNDEKIKRLESENSELNTNLANLAKVNDSIEIKYSKLNENLEKLNFSHNHLKSENMTLFKSNRESDVTKIADLEFEINNLRNENDNLNKENLTLYIERTELVRTNKELLTLKNDLNDKLRYSERKIELKRLDKNALDPNLEFSYSLIINTPSFSTGKKSLGTESSKERSVVDYKLTNRSEIIPDIEEKITSNNLELGSLYVKDKEENKFSQNPSPYFTHLPFPKTNNNISPFHGKENERIEDWLLLN
ncbi:hypothetical protein BpHYR1_028965 [Brachionus plicatilis]|uniref:Uncharacterized protein n=1 Tax=Brachionus plicatilis TaxID=10195 RepID=A0A3M7PBC2_BRAPC|nr:hypothetical protein BpHYR1_028965 [Brachionus plicatilis]